MNLPIKCMAVQVEAFRPFSRMDCLSMQIDFCSMASHDVVFVVLLQGTRCYYRSFPEAGDSLERSLRR